MLQRLIRHHGQALRVRPEIWDAADAASDASDGAPTADMDSDVDGDVDDAADSDTAAFQWLQATAYAGANWSIPWPGPGAKPRCAALPPARACAC
jgi:hypothetical protein